MELCDILINSGSDASKPSPLNAAVYNDVALLRQRVNVVFLVVPQLFRLEVIA